MGSRRSERAPVWIAVLAALGAAFFVIPLLGLIVRTPWGDAWRSLTSPDTLEALRLSMIASLSSTAVALVLGVPLAWVYARIEFPGKAVLRALTTLPMVLPPVVGGIALLLAFGRRGLFGQLLDSAFGITLPFTTPGVVFAETFVAMPFLVLTVEAGLRSMDRRYEEAARTLGARRWTVLTRVTLPLIAPSLAAGAVLCWARALGEFGATITFVSNIPGETQTISAAIYTFTQIPSGDAQAFRLVAIAIVIALAALIASEWFARRAGMRYHGD
jgi:molybdate transport system permease protein